MNAFRFNSRLRSRYRFLGILLRNPVLGPQIVSLEVSHFCNLRCRFCESHSPLVGAPLTERRIYAGGRRMMALETVQELARDLGGAATDLVELSGKGEPLAHPQCAEIVATIREAGLACAIVTNGTLARNGTAPALVRAGLNRLSVSLNAASPETHRLVTGSELWGRAVGFVADVLSERTQRGTPEPWVRVTHVITVENAAEIDGMVALALQLGVDELGWSALGELPQTSHLRMSPEQSAHARESIPGWAARLDAGGIRHNLFAFRDDLASRVRPLAAAGARPVQQNPLQKRLPCYDPWTFCVIGPDGTVSPCCYCDNLGLGNVTERPFPEVWHGEAYRRLRAASLNMPKSGVPICEECFTSCNRAAENHRIWNRLHPFQTVTPPAVEEKVPQP